ncbi:PorT family protein [Flavobacterium sp. J49]|uniref:porin family protein n=1 Tax=Flavobacterium sp. J49 TaxID=2718534 RepID=UPI0015932572|nr:porin family protein [Flavobacterium sp. J49]MBF6640680.1 PorT family protein [Flavobacterium sp. J49]NIC01927.1 PorT family protein [Flavobacterium sp. J49]
MKNIVLSAIALLGLSLSLSAQKKGDVEFGFNVGYNSYSVSDAHTASDAGIGYNFAGSIDYYFSNAWSIKGKLIYDQKGWDNGFIEDEFGSFTTDFNLNYVTLPVMASWHFGNNRNWYLHFGPYFGFLLNAEETRYGEDITEAFNENDFGFALGIGVKIPVSNKLKLFFELDGQGGLTDIFKQNNYSAVTNSRTSFNIGLNFLMK